MPAAEFDSSSCFDRREAMAVVGENHPTPITLDLKTPPVDVNAPLDARDIELVQQTFARNLGRIVSKFLDGMLDDFVRTESAFATGHNLAS